MFLTVVGDFSSIRKKSLMLFHMEKFCLFSQDLVFQEYEHMHKHHLKKMEHG